MLSLSKILKASQKDLLKELPVELSQKGYENNMLVTSKYIFAKGTIPIMLVAHLDTVHTTPVEELFYDKKKDVMWSPERNRWR